jgi:3-oxoacyl-[acyl-carrier protein] reductase
MDLGIAGRVAVVTGAGRGIGAALAALLREEGATVVDASRASGIDVTAPDVGERVLEAAGGPVDILVNNAGTSFARPLHELTDADWQGQWDLNVTGPRRLMLALAPPMAERGWGRIVNVASSSGRRPSGTNAAYSVTKAAELALSRLFAEAYAGTGVLVNAVTPGAVAGPLWLAPGGLADQLATARGATREDVVRGQEGRIPLGRLGTPEEVAAVIAVLCSERAAFVTGAAWAVDGGAVPAVA